MAHIKEFIETTDWKLIGTVVAGANLLPIIFLLTVFVLGVFVPTMLLPVIAWVAGTIVIGAATAVISFY
jgi:hypothetical protein